MEAKQTKTSSADGSAYAAIFAAAIGCIFFAVFADLTEISANFKKHMGAFYTPSGDLSGKSTVAVLIWLTAWIVLHILWSKKKVATPGLISVLSVMLILLSLVMTFPPTFEWLAAHV
jgi:uncharacterized membrane protein